MADSATTTQAGALAQTYARALFELSAEDLGLVDWGLARGAGAEIGGGMGVFLGESGGERIDRSGGAEDDSVWLVDGVGGPDEFARFRLSRITGDDHTPGLLQGKIESLKHVGNGLGYLAHPI